MIFLWWWYNRIQDVSFFCFKKINVDAHPCHEDRDTGISGYELFRKEMSEAHWDAGRGTTEALVKKGKTWTATGCTSDKGQHLAFIEEVVWIEPGASGPHGCYSYLRELGCIVGRCNVLWTKEATSNPSSTARKPGRPNCRCETVRWRTAWWQSLRSVDGSQVTVEES